MRHQFKELPITGRRAEVIKRRIQTHLKFRESVDAKEFKGNRFVKPDDATREELRREVFIHSDILRLLRKKGMADHPHFAEHMAALAALHDELEKME